MAYPKLPRLPQESGGSEEDEFTKLPGLPQDAGAFDIARIAKERFGVDISPEARAQAESAARTRQAAASGSAAAQQLFAGMAGKPGSADAGIESQRQAIDADTIGAFDAKRKRTIEDVEFGDKQLDRARKRAVEDTEFERTGIEYQEETDPSSQLSGMAREAAAKLGVKVAPDTSYRTIKKVAPWLVERIQKQSTARYDPLMDPNSPSSAALRDSFGEAYGLEMDPGVVGRAAAMAAQIRSPAAGRARAQRNFETLRGKELTELRDLTGVLHQTDSIGAGLPGWDTGFIKNRADRAKWFAGLDDPSRAAVRSKLGLNLAEFIKSRSGLAVSDQERQFLESLAPNVEDDEDTLFSKLEAFRDFHELKLKNFLDVTGAEDGGRYNVPQFESLRPNTPPVQTQSLLPAGQQPAPGGTIRFEVPGKGVANIPADKAAAFRAKYPNAKRVQ